MTTSEAKEIYLKADCSYFQMCNSDYSGYLAYRRLEIAKTQEDRWKKEKMRILYRELQKTGNYLLFDRLYEVAADFRDYETLLLLVNALELIKQPMSQKQGITVAETILGKRFMKVRSGMIYWAYDNGQRGIMLLLLDYVMHCLEDAQITEVDLEKRMKKAYRLYHRIRADLNLEHA